MHSRGHLAQWCCYLAQLPGNQSQAISEEFHPAARNGSSFYSRSAGVAGCKARQ